MSTTPYSFCWPLELSLRLFSCSLLLVPTRFVLIVHRFSFLGPSAVVLMVSKGELSFRISVRHKFLPRLAPTKIAQEGRRPTSCWSARFSPPSPSVISYKRIYTYKYFFFNWIQKMRSRGWCDGEGDDAWNDWCQWQLCSFALVLHWLFWSSCSDCLNWLFSLFCLKLCNDNE